MEKSAPRVICRGVATLDVRIGQRLRERRAELGLSQETVARAIEVSAQQLQKYETGQNRVSATRLHALASYFATPIGWFFEPVGIEAGQDPEQNGQQELSTQSLGAVDRADGIDRDLLKVSRLIRGLPSDDTRRRAVRLIRLMLMELEPALAKQSASRTNPTSTRRHSAGKQ